MVGPIYSRMEQYLSMLSRAVGVGTIAEREMMAFIPGYYLWGGEPIGAPSQWIRAKKPFAITLQCEANEAREIGKIGLSARRAKRHIRELARKTGVPFRLPREHEYEMALRSDPENVADTFEANDPSLWNRATEALGDGSIYVVWADTASWLRQGIVQGWMNHFELYDIGTFARISLENPNASDFGCDDQTSSRCPENQLLESARHGFGYFASALSNRQLYAYRTYRVSPEMLVETDSDSASGFTDFATGFWEFLDVPRPLRGFEKQYGRSPVVRRIFSHDSGNLIEQRLRVLPSSVYNRTGYRLALDLPRKGLQEYLLSNFKKFTPMAIIP